MFKLILKEIIEILIIIYVSLIIMGVFFSDKLIFRPQKSSYEDNDSIIKLKITSDVTISTIYMPAPSKDNNTFTVLISHGNSEDIGTVMHFANELNKRGFAVMLYDYPGYGTSTGKPNERNSYKSVLAVYDYLINKKNIKPNKIIAYGHSLGGALAIYLASKKPVAGLFIESGFVSTFRVLTIYPLLPFDKFNNLKRITKIQIPKVFVHGKEDNVVPFWHGEKLYEKSNAPKDYLWLENANHNDCKLVEPKRYWKKWDDIIHLINKKNY